MGSEGQDSPGERTPSRGRVLRRSVAAVTGVVVCVAVAAVALLTPHGGAPAVRPRAAASPVRRADDHQFRIVFASRSDTDGRYHLHVVNPDGTGESDLTWGPDEDKAPAWSPDRAFIAFTRAPHASTPEAKDTHIYIMKADGTGLIQLTQGPDEDRDPSWAPDGTGIVFAAKDTPSGQTRLVIANVDGTPPPQLPTPPTGCVDLEPAWSPDGLTIAFARKCGDDPSALYLMHLDGTGVRQLTTFGRTPDWSPDGSKIAYTGYGRYGPAVFVINANGTGKVELTTDFSGDPVWSPDGGRIVFTVNEVAILKLYVINVDGTGIHRLTDGSSNEVGPSW